MKKLVLITLLISIIFISGCVEEQQTPDQDSDQQQDQQQQTNFYPLSESDKQLVMEQITDPQAFSYDDIEITSIQSLTSVTIVIEATYRESDVTKIFEILTEYSNTQAYTITFIIDKGMVGDYTDDTHCVYTASVDKIHELDSNNWIGWKEAISVVQCS